MSRSNNFDGVRLIAALAVLFSHQFALTGRAEPALGGIPLGSYAVFVFFAMSGYLVTASWIGDPNLARFMARRLLRIWPALAIVVTTCASMAIYLDFDPPFGRMAGQEYLYNLVFAGFDWPFFQANPWHQMNLSLWSIPYEVKCYVALGALAFLSGRHLRSAAVLAATPFLGHIPPRWFFTGRSFLRVHCSFKSGAAMGFSWH
jgi:peptidoglycan/LPS O-acetylase OafA/YrhL